MQCLDDFLAYHTVKLEKSYTQYDNSGYSYPYQAKDPEMASYVLLKGFPDKEFCQVQGLTPRETLYIKVRDKKIWSESVELFLLFTVKI